MPAHTSSNPETAIPRAYDQPGLTLVQFLSAIMHATNLGLSIRMNAAKALSLFPPYSNPEAIYAISPHPVPDLKDRAA
jgi:hypothetical protein